MDSKKSLAIAYHAKSKRKKMAKGGEADAPHGTEVIDSPGGFGKIIIIKHNEEKKMAEGGILDKAKGVFEDASRKGYLGSGPRIAQSQKDSKSAGGQAAKPKAVDSAWSSTRYAEGGQVNAKSQKRPMPEQTADDAKMVSRNSGKKALTDAGWTSDVTVRQAQKPSLTKLSRPALKGSDAFSVRYADEIDQDLHRIESEAPDGYGKQPKRSYNEEEADKSGPDTSAIHMKRMKDGGMINDAVSMDEAEEDRVEHPEGLTETDSSMGPAEDEYMADHMFADGGMAEDEIDEEDHASIAAAIMAKRHKMADGGQVDIKSNGEEEANQYYARNEAALKENYDSDMSDVEQPMDSNEHGDAIDSDDHDHIEEMRKRIHLKRMK